MKSNEPAPDETAVHNAMLRALKALGLEPQEDWIFVRFVPGQEATYTVVVTHEPARVALSRLLRWNATSVEDYAVGVWVLDESEARRLCEAPPAEPE